MSIAQFKAGTLVRVPIYAVKSRGFGPRRDGKGGRSFAMYTYADGRTCKHSDGEQHDCAYVDARNRLIPEAERAVYAKTAGADDPAGMLRMRTFFAEMDRLWAEWKERR